MCKGWNNAVSFFKKCIVFEGTFLRLKCIPPIFDIFNLQWLAEITKLNLSNLAQQTMETFEINMTLARA